jgi:tRNA pseudouridine38-40 synthase
MRNIRLVIEYDGTGYHGWQSQINAVAIQDVIQAAVMKITGEECSLTGSSRTDAGVHALGQVANFMTDSNVPAERFSYALNSVLPSDIVIKESAEVDADFHSRYSAKGKKYKYLIHNSPKPSALLRNRAFQVTPELDSRSMLAASQYLLGRHDFSAFRASGSGVESSERTITGVDLIKDGEIIEFYIEGDGFLYNMVRIIAWLISDCTGNRQGKCRKSLKAGTGKERVKPLRLMGCIWLKSIIDCFARMTYRVWRNAGFIYLGPYICHTNVYIPRMRHAEFPV